MAHSIALMNREPLQEDLWIPSVCYMCYSCCGTLARRVNGVVVEVRGHPDNPHNEGKLCAKGKAALMSLYNPGRVRRPLKRTNPKKGLGVDPGWQEISYEQAMEEVAQQLKRIRQEDPRKLLVAHVDFHLLPQLAAFATAFGTPNFSFNSASYFCGNALHPISYLMTASFYLEPDFDYCNYLILWGSQLGFMIDTNATLMTKRMAEARARGMKVVVIDPVGNHAAAKADEWIPIRPGTDAALALGILNILLNELGIYDGEYIRRKTNGPYLIGQDGRYLRDRDSGKPLVWDQEKGGPAPYDAVPCQRAALLGTYQVQDKDCAPAFQFLCDHVKNYPRDEVAKITTVPGEVIFRLAHQFGQAAQIGSRIVIRGAQLPFRPAGVMFTRGSTAHKHGMLAGLALSLLNLVVGAYDVPGGILGLNPVGPYGRPREGPDGLLYPAEAMAYAKLPFPGIQPSRPQTLELSELFPLAIWSRTVMPLTLVAPEEYQLPYRIEAMLHARTNPLMGTSTPGDIAAGLSKIPFVVSFARELDETVEFADIIIPEAHFMERLDPFPNLVIEWIAAGQGPWYFEMGQPLVPSLDGVHHLMDLLLQVARRVGFASDFYRMLNLVLGLKEPYRLDEKGDYAWEEIADLWARCRFGSEHDLNWFKKQGFLVTSRKSLEEAYPGPFVEARLPLYLEHFKGVGEELRRVVKELGLSWDTSDYQPLPDWKPCPAYEEEGGAYDLYAVNYKLPFHTFSYTTDNPWLAELAEHHVSAFKVVVNTEVARRKGIKENSPIWVESMAGQVKGRAHLSQCIHPEVVGIAGTFGHWARELTVAKGKGVHFNTLLPSSLERIDMVSAALDACVRVQVRPAPE